MYQFIFADHGFKVSPRKSPPGSLDNSLVFSTTPTSQTSFGKTPSPSHSGGRLTPTNLGSLTSPINYMSHSASFSPYSGSLVYDQVRHPGLPIVTVPPPLSPPPSPSLTPTKPGVPDVPYQLHEPHCVILAILWIPRVRPGKTPMPPPPPPTHPTPTHWVALTGFMRYFIYRIVLKKLMSSTFVSYYFTILSYISIKFSDNVLS